MAKYEMDGAFTDPVLRCHACTRLILVADLRTQGMCECGNRRVRNVLAHSESEGEWMRERNVDPEFLALFEARA